MLSAEGNYSQFLNLPGTTIKESCTRGRERGADRYQRYRRRLL